MFGSGFRATVTHKRVIICVVSLLLGGLHESTAEAEVKGFALDRFEPAERGSDWFGNDSLDLRGTNRWAFGGVFDWAHRPLVAYDQAGNETVVIIENQLFAHLGASVNLIDRIRLSANLPVLVLQNGDRASIGAEVYRAGSAPALGDLRIGGDVTISGTYGDAAVLAVGAQIFIPTGSRRAYASDGQLRGAPHATLAGTVGYFVYSLRAGLMFRNDYTAPARTLAADVQVGGALGVALFNKRLVIGPEVWLALPITDMASTLFDDATPPLEGTVAAHLRVGDFRFGLGVGPGITGAPGTPVLRTLASIEWFPDFVEPLRDTDGDQVADADDACPGVPGTAEAINGSRGCPAAPAPVDRDQDGVLDADDKCVEVAGFPSPGTPQHGCPKDTDRDGIIDSEDQCSRAVGVRSSTPAKNGCPLDADSDGIWDADDACPTQAGAASSTPDKNGCPVDADADGILNETDACPQKPGPASADASQNGCPRVQVKSGQLVILDRIEFETNQATLRSTSEAVLTQVLQAITNNPQITRIRIEGHTDNRGNAQRNLKLSQERAESVVAWLVAHGVPAARLSAEGHGAKNPIESNDSELGRQNNRRVEFHLEVAEPAPPDPLAAPQ